MVEVLERGDIAFWYRPRVQAAGALVHTPGVQSFFFVLSTGGRHRRLRIGRKRMPSPTGQRFWVRVERVGSFRRAVGDQLEDEHYRTKTRGDRFQPGARPIAQGCYALVRHDDHIHLVHRVEHVERPEELTEEIAVPEASSLIVLFERTPRTKATWTTAGSIDLLDEEGAEVVLVGVDDEPEDALGVDIVPAPSPRP